MEQISTAKMHGGTHHLMRHQSARLGCQMDCAVFVPDKTGPHRALFFLSGLTCTWENAATKAGAQKLANELGLILIFPDTSPRGDDVPDDDDYALGQGAGFYMTATRSPWARHYRMDSYICDELLPLIRQSFSVADGKCGITGHSMGGHGALTLAIKRPDLFGSVSAFSPIVAPTKVPWGRTIFTAYLGEDETLWSDYDACHLITTKGYDGDILIDVGKADSFLDNQLLPHLFEQAANKAGVDVTLRLQPGYDHSYYFVASFIDDHLQWHADRLK
ncbi:MAG: S-formylglutathione hydrolase [Candidatus Puniceispirillaceae bacterium]